MWRQKTGAPFASFLYYIDRHKKTIMNAESETGAHLPRVSLFKSLFISLIYRKAFDKTRGLRYKQNIVSKNRE